MRASSTLALAVALIAAAPAAAARRQAPGAPGAKATFLPADKHAFGTSRTRGSDVWFTLRQSAMSEVTVLRVPATSSRPRGCRSMA